MDPKEPTYESVSLSEDRDELLSNTDVAESLMGDEKRWQSRDLETGRSSRRKTLLSTCKTYRWLIDTSLLLVIVGLLSVLVWDRRTASEYRWQVGGDISKGGPEIETRIVKWNADDSFVPSNMSEFFSNQTLARWNTLMPVGAGWGSGSTFSTTSMTHQLHCLFMMGRIYSGITTNRTQFLPTDYHSHFLHCIDYLRQAIMCAGDMALELHSPTDSDDLGPLDGGWNGRHVCKDYGQVISYLEGQINEGVRVVLPIDD